ncbi:MAG: SH3 domain-containing protein, partial [Nitrospinales bacterium]
MKFLPRDSAPETEGPQSGRRAPIDGKRKGGAKGEAVSSLQKDFEEQLKVLEKIPKPSRAKIVVVDGAAVVLRKGPGVQFKKIGVAHKGDRFKLLRKARDPKRGHIWYLIQDEGGQKSFISGLFSTVKRPTRVVK